MHFSDLTYIPISAISMSRCGLKILTETFLSGNLTYINAVRLARGKSLEQLSGYDSAGFILFLAVLWIPNFS